jgi:hypothetical protein
MANAQSSMLVVQDQAGSYFVIPQETLERARVPEERAAEVEQILAAARDGVEGDDVHGHHPVAIGIAVACILYTGFDLGYGLAKAAIGPEAAIIDISQVL